MYIIISLITRQTKMYQFGFVGILTYLYLYSYFIPLYHVHSMALA